MHYRVQRCGRLRKLAPNLHSRRGGYSESGLREWRAVDADNIMCPFSSRCRTTANPARPASPGDSDSHLATSHVFYDLGLHQSSDTGSIQLGPPTVVMLRCAIFCPATAAVPVSSHLSGIWMTSPVLARLPFVASVVAKSALAFGNQQAPVHRDGYASRCGRHPRNAPAPAAHLHPFARKAFAPDAPCRRSRIRWRAVLDSLCETSFINRPPRLLLCNSLKYIVKMRGILVPKAICSERRSFSVILSSYRARQSPAQIQDSCHEKYCANSRSKNTICAAHPLNSPEARPQT